MVQINFEKLAYRQNSERRTAVFDLIVGYFNPKSGSTENFIAIGQE